MSLPIILVAAALVAAVGVAPSLLRRTSRRLRPGDRLRIFGGHEMPAPWLGGRRDVQGAVEAVLDNGGPGVVVVRLDEYLRVAAPGRGGAGSIAILELRFRGARWGRREVVSVRLAESMPHRAAEVVAFPAVESHAVYRRRW